MTAQDPRRNGAHVLVGVDGSDSAIAAAAWAADECSRTGVELHLVHCALTGRSRLDAEKILARAADAAAQSAPTVPIIPQQVTGSPGTELVRLSTAAGLLVIGHRESDVSPAGAESTAVQLTLGAHCPVVICRPMTVSGSSPRVVVGLDGSTVSTAAARFAIEAASRRNIPLVAVMAWPEIVVDDASQSLRIVSDWDNAASNARRLLDEQLAEFQEKFPDVSIVSVVTRDRPVRGLLRECAEAQLLVVGSHGRRGFRTMTLGSTSQALIDCAPCPLAVVRDTGRSRHDKLR